MQVRLMITDGGPHSPETLAWGSAQRMVDDFREHAPQAAYSEVMDFRDKIEAVLTAHHRLIQNAERGALKTQGPARLIEPLDTHAFIEDALDDLLAAARERVNGKPRWPTLNAYLQRPQTRRYFEDVLHMEFHQNMHIERSWHADAHPKHPHAVAFRAIMIHGHGLLALHDDDLKEHGGREVVSAIVANMIPYCAPKNEG